MSKSGAAQLGGGLIGAAVGFVIGGPTGAQLGFALGSAAGGALVPAQLPDITGPRLDDLSVAGSSFGTGIPIVYGTHRLACQMIWTAGKKETKHTEEVGGKGAPEQEVTTYTYSLDAAFAICRGEIVEVRRVWINGKLVYERAENSTASALSVNSQLAADITVYPGSETQLPSSLQEAHEGAGNVPAYRGLAYIEFDDLQLAEFGNGAVNVEVEVVTGGAVVDPPSKVSTHTTDWNANGAIRDGILIYNSWTQGTPSSTQTYIKTNYCSLDGDLLAQDSYTAVTGATAGFAMCQNDPDIFAGRGAPTDSVKLYLRSVYGIEYLGDMINPISGTADYQAVDPISTTGTTRYTYNNMIVVGDYLVSLHRGTVGGYARIGIARRKVDKYAGTIDLSANKSEILVNLGFPFSAVQSQASGFYGLIPDDSGDYFWVYTIGSPAGTHKLARLDIDFNVLNTWTSFLNTGRCAFRTMPSGLKGVMYSNLNYMYLREFDHTTTDSALTAGVSVYDTSITSTYLDSIGNGLVKTTGSIWTYDELIAQAGAALDDVVTDICETAGMSASDIDVAALSADTVRGYIVANNMAARSALEPLMKAYFFDMVVVDDKLTAVYRGGASARTITSDDMAAVVDGNSLADIKVIRRKGAKELPKRLTARFVDINADYHLNEVHSDRLTAQGDGIAVVDIPVVMTADEAVQICDAWLYATYAEREGISISLSTKNIDVVPTDVITADGYRVRVEEINNILIGPIGISGVVDYIDAYTSVRTGSEHNQTSTMPGIYGPTSLALIDIPILQDADDSEGIYIAAAGYLPQWTAGIVYKSDDYGVSFSQVKAVTSQSVIGSATTVLADGITSTWDSANSVTIRPIDGQSLSSASEISVLNGSNAAVIGQHEAWEIIQWKTAVDNGDGTFTLSDLLRGRIGTEHNTAAHAIGDKFITLSAPQLARLSPVTVGSEYIYKGVTSGNLLQNANPVIFTNTGESQKPLSPVNIAGTRDGSNNLTVTWDRRSRYRYTWRYELPLGEDSEAYELEFWDSTGVTHYGSSAGVPIKDATSETFAYTIALQSADTPTPTPGQSFLVKIYQMSAAVGRGHLGSLVI